jgi:arylsulfatase A-like enzyme
MYSDDHTPQAVGAYQGNLDYGLELDHTPTPNIDQLAKQGMRFDNAFVTNSICKPSRAVLLTGLHSHKNGVPTNGQSISKQMLTFPQLLQKEGYQTAIVGKWHLGTAPQGFDYYEVLYGQGPYYNPKLRRKENDTSFTGHTSDIITNRTLKWLKKRRKDDQPFMLMMNHKAPHRNWVPAPDHVNLYDDRDLPLPDSLFYDYEGLTSAAKKQKMEIANHMSWGSDLKLQKKPGGGSTNWTNGLTKKQEQQLIEGYKDENQYLHEHYEDMSQKEIARWKYQRYVKDYLRVVQGIDDSVGRLMNYLKEAGLAENTIVVYSADQGFFLGENGWFDKRWIYEESLRQPLIVRWPGQVKAGSVNDDLVQNLDFAPTLLDLAGAEIPKKMQGRSIVPLMKGETPENWRNAVYYHYYEGINGAHSVRRHYGLRTERYTLAHFYKDDEWELFDLKKDPEQLQSVYGDSEYADVQKKLKEKLNQLQEKYGDTNPEEPTENVVQRIQGDLIKETVNAIELEQVLQLKDGSQTPPQNLNPSRKPISVGAHVKTSSPDGAIISRGGRWFGYMLYITDRKPAFAVRTDGKLKTVVADEQIDLNKSVHITGVLDKDAKLHVYKDGEHLASSEGHFILTNPGDDLTIGADAGSRVGTQSGKLTFDGTIRDLRLYWGVLKSKQIKDWASGGSKENASSGTESSEDDSSEKADEGANKQSNNSNEPPISKMKWLGAAHNGQTATVREAIKNGMDVHVTSRRGQTALMLAAYNGHKEIVKLLLENGAKVDVKDKNGRTALMYASTGSFPKTVKLLLENGADTNVQGNQEGFTPLMFSATEGNVEVAKILLEHGADKTIQDTDNDTALDFAKRQNKQKLIDLLE